MSPDNISNASMHTSARHTVYNPDHAPNLVSVIHGIQSNLTERANAPSYEGPKDVFEYMSAMKAFSQPFAAECVSETAGQHIYTQDFPVLETALREFQLVPEGFEPADLFLILRENVSPIEMYATITLNTHAQGLRKDPDYDGPTGDAKLVMVPLRDIRHEISEYREKGNPEGFFDSDIAKAHNLTLDGFFETLAFYIRARKEYLAQQSHDDDMLEL